MAICITALVLCLLVAVSPGAESTGNVVVITSKNFSEVLDGEWMVEFFAPWCSACKQFASTWESFGDWASESDVDVRVGKVDVTTESMLSGQFAVTHLPTIYHIKDGVVREYFKSRQLTALIEFIEESQWRETSPVPWWRSPTAFHMRALGLTFWLSEKAKTLQVYLQDEYELPTYAVFIGIALATIVFGLALGGITVCCIEVCMRLCGRHKEPSTPKIPRKRKSNENTEKHPQEDEGSEVATETKKEVVTESTARYRKGKKAKGSSGGGTQQ